MNNELLIEIGCEELPPKALKKLGTSFLNEVQKQCKDNNISFSNIQWFAAPRRLGLLLSDVPEFQPDSIEEKKGPAFNVAFDENGEPTKAASGWARSLGLELEDVDTLETDKGKWLYKKVTVKGKNINSLIPDIVEKSLAKLPIPKMMRWGSSDFQFVRPVHNYCLLYGNQVIPATLFGVTASNKVLGHRFHSPGSISLEHASHYERTLKSEHVIPSFESRKDVIKQQVAELAEQFDANASYDEDLLDEITSLVEWPVTLSATFPESFLEVPKEALIYTMKDDQKYIPLLDSDGNLLDRFLFVSNISSNAPEKVISGNERVIRPRLHDAQFFYNEDKKVSSDTRLDSLKSIVYQKQLGTMYERALRIANLAKALATKISPADAEKAYQAGLYAKSDLASQMVYEFPSVQGSMGKYYARLEGKDKVVCDAIEEHYLPRFAGDVLPEHPVSIAASLADKLDQIVGIFSIGQIPTGDKDPFALRRSAIGVLRICIEQAIELPLGELVKLAQSGFNDDKQSETFSKVFEFISSRISTFYTDQGYSVNQINAVINVGITSLLDVDTRMRAARALVDNNSENMTVMAALNKRVFNILKKEDSLPSTDVKEELLTEAAELALFNAVTEASFEQNKFIEKGEFDNALVNLLSLNQVISEFFDSVMVNVEDESVRQNRLALLLLVRSVFTKVIDFAELD